MKKLVLIALFFLVACSSQPNEADIQTAIAKTQGVQAYQISTPVQSLYTSNPSPTNTPACISWDAISLKDVGKSVCIKGNVYYSYIDKGMFYITFDPSPTSLFLFSNRKYTPLKMGTCIIKGGKIIQVGRAPAINMDNSQLPFWSQCSE